MGILQNWKKFAKQLKAECRALFFACKDRRTPWYARFCAALVVAYALSPIDLIPDWIPVLGYLDDLIIVPLGVALVIRMIPEQIMAQSRQRAMLEQSAPLPRRRTMAVLIVTVWVMMLAAAFFWLKPMIAG